MREYLTKAILLLLRANIAIMSSVTLPHVAFKSPPTVNQETQRISCNNTKCSNIMIIKSIITETRISPIPITQTSLGSQRKFKSISFECYSQMPQKREV